MDDHHHQLVGHPFDSFEEDVDDADTAGAEEDSAKSVEIRIWCLTPPSTAPTVVGQRTEKSSTFVVIVKHFTLKCFVEIPDFFHPYGMSQVRKEWTPEDINKLVVEISRIAKVANPVSGRLVKKSKLHYYQSREKAFSMIELSLKSMTDMAKIESVIENAARIPAAASAFSSRGRYYGKYFGNMVLRVWEGGRNIVTPTRRLFSAANIEYTQWTTFKSSPHSGPVIEKGDPRNEYDVPCIVIDLAGGSGGNDDIVKYIVPYRGDDSHHQQHISSPSILAFDIEVYSHRPTAFPNALNELDKMFMISCVYYIHRGGEGTRRRFLIHSEDALVSHDVANHPAYAKEGMKNIEFLVTNDEKSMIDAFGSLVEELDPDIITGYNIHGFDYKYMDIRNRITERALLGEWPVALSRSKKQIPKAKTTEWQSSGAGIVKTTTIEMEGRLSIDVMPWVKRNYKLSVYNLKSVAAEFLPESAGKLDVTPQEMFDAYKSSMALYNDASGGVESTTKTGGSSFLYQRTVNRMTHIAAYAIRDSDVVIDLFEKLNMWPGLVELSAVAGVTIKDTFRGQQLRVASLLYDICTREDTVIDTRTFKKPYSSGSAGDDAAAANPAKIRFKGGFVMEPKVGITDNVLCGDFVSLYPSIILAYNICYSTLNIKSSLFEDSLYSGKSGRYDLEHTPKLGGGGILAVDTFKLNDERYSTEGKEFHDIEFVNNLNEDDAEGDDDDGSDAPHKKSKKQRDLELLPEYNRRYHFQFVKADVKRGVIPRLVSRLLTSRKDVKRKLKELETKLRTGSGGTAGANETDRKTLELMCIVLDQRQLAYKLIANSTYGFLAAQDIGKLPLVECAMSITAMGRKLIGEVNNYVCKTYNGKIIYGDTDSSMFVLPPETLKSSSECHQWGLKITTEISSALPDPLVLEFEKAMRILCLTKKKYAAFYILPNGELSKKMLVRGIVLARRDNCRYIREMYETVLQKILLFQTPKECLKIIFTSLLKLFEGAVPPDKLSIVTTLGTNYKSPGYKMAVFASECEKQGRPVQPGDRLEYIIAVNPSSVPSGESGIKIDNFGLKMRMLETFVKNRHSPGTADEIDYMYYIDHLFKNPIDQLISIAFPETEHLLRFDPKTLCFSSISSGSTTTISIRTPIAFFCKIVTTLNRKRTSRLPDSTIAKCIRKIMEQI
jgi:DNA polymerase elongation subunit (family B)